MARTENDPKCMRPSCPYPQPHGPHCPRIPTARLASCAACSTPLLLAAEYPAGRHATCGPCAERALHELPEPTPAWARRLSRSAAELAGYGRDELDGAPVDDLAEVAGDFWPSHYASQSYAERLLLRAEATMRLRAMAAGRTYRGAEPAPRAVWRAEATQ